MKTISLKLMLAAAVLTVGLAPVREARADSPPPPPVISIYHMNAYGGDLEVTLWADSTTGDLPGTAYVRVTDTNGDLVNKVPFTPVSGMQTVWVPGAFTARPSDVLTLPIERDLDVYGGLYSEIFASTGSALISPTAGAGPVISKPRRVQAKKYCYLHLIKIICYKTESSGADHAYMKINLGEFWRHDMDEWNTYEFGDWIPMG